ncbi:glycosyltransferase family 2 protein [uncultured Roseovarius sp.]|uniref:glycosyltransferase family 2 protein n=1 Tax=uncultured Roseovarius sp. TaxID=293344 RepID=UPI002636CD66|nr:glycosyltransferase family 2 protein [uncultured Roseovarius sp.]
MTNQPSWGVTATVKAPTRDVLNFAAHHLDLGAERVSVYLDAPDNTAHSALNAHPKCRAITTDASYWHIHGYRPIKHQVRQQVNATHCLTHEPGTDWLAHLDVDEFLWPGDTSLAAQLAALPNDTFSARSHPVEAMAPDPADPPPAGAQWFKSCATGPSQRRTETAAIYPGFGTYLVGGFLSHVQGKVFIRTGRPSTGLRIHHATQDGENDTPAPLTGTNLCHLHATGFDHWNKHYRYRIKKGAYRPSIKPAPGSDTTLHSLLCQLEAQGGDALRNFYDQICRATPALRARLAAYGHLHLIRLDLDKKRARHFPDFA